MTSINILFQSLLGIKRTRTPFWCDRRGGLGEVWRRFNFAQMKCPKGGLSVYDVRTERGKVEIYAKFADKQ